MLVLLARNVWTKLIEHPMTFQLKWCVDPLRASHTSDVYPRTV